VGIEAKNHDFGAALMRAPEVTELHKERFIKALSSGKSPTYAAEQAEVSRSMAYIWRAEDPEFAKAWKNAAAEGIDRIEDEAHRRAVEGVARPVFQGGQKVGEITDYSDGLMTLLLRGRRPDVPRPEPVRVEVAVTTLEEARRQIESLGLPMLQIETDYEDVSEAEESKTNHGD
jgi:hypothetical protein